MGISFKYSKNFLDKVDRSAPPLARSILDTIGKTPMVELSNLVKELDLHPHSRILLKLEQFNPGLSIKDRIALHMIQQAESKGLLSPGQTVIELTSGSTGTGLAIVCASKGYPFVAVMSIGNSNERVVMMRAFGAEVHLVPQSQGSVPGTVNNHDLELVEKETQRLQKELGAFRCDQFTLESNYKTHYKYTAEEIYEQAGGNVAAFCNVVGTGGTFLGTSKLLKERYYGLECYVVEPETASFLGTGQVINPSHKIQGVGYGLPFNKLQFNLENEDFIDGYIAVSDEDAAHYANLLAKCEGIFVGYSSGCNIAAAVQLLQGKFEGKTIVCFACDSGLKYISTNLWEGL
eukprot:TRINITY_DN823_c0_g1_i1.p1 TRINITY_DN823_c0_g1~~TRINITY_DN823_c0_g1_i1.p1  ORF type:complete len:347 (-),score=75.43 TRINITY_DN823_c0_g1_i1:24-1064(-)